MLENGLFNGFINPLAASLAEAFIPWAFAPRSARRALRRDLDGADLFPGPGPADRRHFLHRVRRARGFRVPSPPGGDGQPALQADGAQREGRPADDPGPGLRHDGDVDDPHPRDPQGAAHRHPVAGSRRTVFRATDGGPDDARRALPGSRWDLARSRCRDDPARRRPGGAGSSGTGQRFRPRTSADAVAQAGQHPREDAGAHRVVSQGSGPAFRARHAAPVLRGSTTPSRRPATHGGAGPHRLAGPAEGNRPGVRRRVPAPGLRGGGPLPHVPGRPTRHRGRRRVGGHDHAIHPLYREFLHDGQGARLEDRPRHRRVHLPVRPRGGSGAELDPSDPRSDALMTGRRDQTVPPGPESVAFVRGERVAGGSHRIHLFVVRIALHPRDAGLHVLPDERRL